MKDESEIGMPVRFILHPSSFILLKQGRNQDDRRKSECRSAPDRREQVAGPGNGGRVPPLECRAGLLWWAGFLVSFGLLLIGTVAVSYQMITGIGTWGLNRTVGWAFDITNFVFWIGIGHAGTLISAILFLFRQRWRNSVNRSAEAMTLFAVMCAGLFPLIHMGRPWLAYWFFPTPTIAAPCGSTSAPRWSGTLSPSPPIS